MPEWHGSESDSESPVLNMLGLRIWQGCEYARITQSRVLNMPE